MAFGNWFSGKLCSLMPKGPYQIYGKLNFFGLSDITITKFLPTYTNYYIFTLL